MRVRSATPLLALTAAAGVAMVAYGYSAAREGSAHAQPLFWGGLVAIYAPIALRLLSRSASRRERLALSLLLGGALYLVKVVYEPTGFTLHDELATWRQTSDLVLTGHAFSANPLVAGYAGFPGLELFTASLSQLTGLRIFIAATIVIGVARVALMLALFLFLERVARSPRAAGIAIAIYVCNPSFLYFDSQFGYESLALVVGAALLLAALRWSSADEAARRRNARGMVAAMAILAATLTITHHMTSYATVAFLATWAALEARERRSGPRGWLYGPALPALMLAAAAAGWFALEAGSVTTAELGKVLADAARSVVHLVFGGSGPKTLFQSGGQTNTTAARFLGIASVVPLLAAIPLGLRRAWRGEGSGPLWRTLSLAALLYPLTLLLRLTQSGTETSQRASEFVFLGLAFIGGLLLAEMAWPRGTLKRLLASASLAALGTVVFLGGFIVGESPITRLPGPFLVEGEARGVSPQGISAALFAAEKLPPGSRVIVDRANSTLVASYGGLELVTGAIEGIPVNRVFFSRTFDAADQRVISNDEIEYIVVDRRLAHEPPANGYYFESTEPRANEYRRPIDVYALRKFNHVRGLGRIFENGAVAIYDTRGLRSR